MRLLKLINFILGILIFACSEQNNSTQKHVLQDESKPSDVNIFTEKAMNIDLQITIQTIGQTVARKTVNTSLNKPGYISFIIEKEGQSFKNGQTILTLQNEEEQIALSEARSSLLKQLTEFGINYPNPDSALAIIEKTFAHDGNENVDNGFIQKVLSGEKQQEVRLAQSGLLDAWNSYRRAQLNYDQTFFKAPFSGYLANIEYKTDQWLSAGTAACTLIDISKIRVECDVLENESSQIKMGALVQVTFPALGRTGIPSLPQGKVTEINPVIDPEKHTMRVTIEIDNPNGKIRPGMYAEVKITTQTLENRLLVPKKAIVIRDNRELVFVVRDSLAQWCYVQTGATGFSGSQTQFGNQKLWVEIISSEFDLKAGEPVVVDGHFSLAHNAKVSVRNNE